MTPGDTPFADRLESVSLAADSSFLLARANALSLAVGNTALAPHGLSARSFAVLALAADDLRPTQRELAAFLRLDPSQVVALVDTLQGRGLVQRRPDPTDRRANVVVATDEGRMLHATAAVSVRTAEEELHSGLDPAERDQLATLLRRIAFLD
ncbi:MULTISPECIES: MarR family winged helix-turn-helix transcriptional regulator [unclassified Microbacterium]|uniref:MarR family winged helix-turn-helix transcriptional regulator n=1 Tax=unclassified Microbacterium TaxID=2609290 RepID=UPI00374748D2